MTDTVATLVADSLEANGIGQLYCLPGVQNDDFFDVLYDRQDRINPVHARHEQGAVYMALGAAMATGKPQAFSIVPGPGFLNGCAALSTAYAVNAPLLALIGQIPSGAIGKGYGLLHEIPDQLGTLKGLTKQAGHISVGDNAAGVLQSAWAALKSGRPRPVGVEVPVNVWKQTVDNRPGDLAIAGLPEPKVDTGRIADAADLIGKARAPLIAAGSGAQHVSDEVIRLAELIDAPVMAFRAGHGVMPADHALHIDLPTGHELWAKTDLVIAIGTRLQLPQMQWGVDDDLKIIHIDIDADELGRINEPAIGINADTADVLPPLIAEIANSRTDRSAWATTVADTKAAMRKRLGDQLAPQLSWLQAIRDVLPRDGIFVDELTQMGYVSRLAFPSYQPRTFLSSGYQGTLGWGIATGLGAAHARRDVPVVSISGDGGALFTIAELATAVHHKIPLTAIVFNDNAFGNVRRFQIENYNNRPIASDLSNPDFVKLSESFGVRSMRAETPDRLRACLRQSFASGEPNLIEVPVGDFPSPWPFILMPKVRGN